MDQEFVHDIVELFLVVYLFAVVFFLEVVLVVGFVVELVVQLMQVVGEALFELYYFVLLVGLVVVELIVVELVPHLLYHLQNSIKIISTQNNTKSQRFKQNTTKSSKRTTTIQLYCTNKPQRTFCMLLWVGFV